MNKLAVPAPAVCDGITAELRAIGDWTCRQEVDEN